MTGTLTGRAGRMEIDFDVHNPAAVLEVPRGAGIGKFGGIPRFPFSDMALGGQMLGKGPVRGRGLNLAKVPGS